MFRNFHIRPNCGRFSLPLYTVQYGNSIRTLFTVPINSYKHKIGYSSLFSSAEFVRNFGGRTRDNGSEKKTRSRFRPVRFISKKGVLADNADFKIRRMRRALPLGEQIIAERENADKDYLAERRAAEAKAKLEEKTGIVSEWPFADWGVVDRNAKPVEKLMLEDKPIPTVRQVRPPVRTSRDPVAIRLRVKRIVDSMQRSSRLPRLILAYKLKGETVNIVADDSRNSRVQLRGRGNRSKGTLFTSAKPSLMNRLMIMGLGIRPSSLRKGNSPPKQKEDPLSGLEEPRKVTPPRPAAAIRNDGSIATTSKRRRQMLQAAQEQRSLSGQSLQGKDKGKEKKNKQQSHVTVNARGEEVIQVEYRGLVQKVALQPQRELHTEADGREPDEQLTAGRGFFAPLGGLDMDAEGLVVLCDDGRLVSFFNRQCPVPVHPSRAGASGKLKDVEDQRSKRLMVPVAPTFSCEYVVTVSHSLPPAAAEALLAGRVSAPKHVSRSAFSAVSESEFSLRRRLHAEDELQQRLNAREQVDQEKRKILQDLKISKLPGNVPLHKGTLSPLNSLESASSTFPRNFSRKELINSAWDEMHQGAVNFAASREPQLEGMSAEARRFTAELARRRLAHTGSRFVRPLLVERAGVAPSEADRTVAERVHVLRHKLSRDDPLKARLGRMNAAEFERRLRDEQLLASGGDPSAPTSAAGVRLARLRLGKRMDVYRRRVMEEARVVQRTRQLERMPHLRHLKYFSKSEWGRYKHLHPEHDSPLHEKDPAKALPFAKGESAREMKFFYAEAQRRARKAQQQAKRRREEALQERTKRTGRLLRGTPQGVRRALEKEEKHGTVYRVTAFSDSTKDIRDGFRHFGVTVTRIVRVRFGPFLLSGLAKGYAREMEAPVSLVKAGYFFHEAAEAGALKMVPLSPRALPSRDGKISGMPLERLFPELHEQELARKYDDLALLDPAKGDKFVDRLL